MSRSLAFTVLIVIILMFFMAIQKSHGRQNQPYDNEEVKGFDYYILSLSWSPEYCNTHMRDDSQQCSEYRDFILHGLWPEYEDTGYPHDCEGDDVPEAVIQDMMKVMPSRHLIIHEWHKHGTCTGLDSSIYFQNAKDAFNNITIPKVFKTPSHDFGIMEQDIKDAFKEANVGLKDENIEVVCRGNELTEVHFCLTKDGKSRACTTTREQCKEPIRVSRPRFE